MVLKLYIIAPSPPVRAVQMCAKALNLELELQEVNLLEMEHLKPDFVKINPQHTVPTLDDDGFILWDSHAIMGYLVEKYADNDLLYPKDVRQRAIVNQRLHFDSGVLFSRMVAITKSIIFEKSKTIPKQQSDALEQAYGFVEAFLGNKKFIAGDFLSIADFSIITTLTSCNIVVPIDLKKYPKIETYIKELENVPYYDANKIGLEMLKTLVETKLSE